MSHPPQSTDVATEGNAARVKETPHAGATPSASTTVAPPSSGVSSSSTPTAPPKPTATVKASTPFRPYRFRAWQVLTTHSTGWSDDAPSVLPPVVYYHGERLGPRPLLILDHTVPPPATATTAAPDHDPGAETAVTKFEAMLSQLSWSHGAVYVPLHVSFGEPDVLDTACRSVCAVLDALDVHWTHFLTHSFGTLVAARMASSNTYPHRIGTFLSLDTPLVTRRLVENHAARRELAKAEVDVNVPAAELAFARESLLQALEDPLPCPAPKADSAVYETVLFDPKAVYDRGGLVRREERYIPLDRLAGLAHPWQLIVPTSNPVSEATVHKDFFGLRRPAVVKAADNHEALFSPEAAGEVGDIVRTWMNRFEPDEVIRRRYDQVAKEMTQLMGGGTSGAGASAGAGATAAAGGKSGKKKEKKKKG